VKSAHPFATRPLCCALEISRPRTEAYIVYLFLMLRGLNGGCKDQHARLLLEESITLKLWLEHLGLELPSASTLSDNLNAVSNRTRGLIHDVQLVIFSKGFWMISEVLHRQYRGGG
jgi:hypothetical protein